MDFFQKGLSPPSSPLSYLNVVFLFFFKASVLRTVRITFHSWQTRRPSATILSQHAEMLRWALRNRSKKQFLWARGCLPRQPGIDLECRVFYAMGLTENSHRSRDYGSNCKFSLTFNRPVVQSRRFCTLVWKWDAQMREHISRIHHHHHHLFYEWGECARVYFFKSSSVQTVLHSNFENRTLQCENTFLASTTSFLWMRRVYQSICF